jgi:hypothetical protein
MFKITIKTRQLHRPPHQHIEALAVIPPCRASQLPELPSLADDFHFYGGREHAQTHEKSIHTQGFSINAKIAKAHHTLSTYSLLEGGDRHLLHDQELNLIQACLQDLDTVLTKAHPELASLPAPGYFEYRASTDLTVTPHVRSHIQTEIQKVVLRTNVLTTRLYLIERLTELQNSNPGMLRQDDLHIKFVIGQYATVIKEMALLLTYMSKASIEGCAKLVSPLLRYAYEAVCQCPKAVEQMKGEYNSLGTQFDFLFGADSHI